MSRLLVTESSKRNALVSLSTSGSKERNRLISWGNPVATPTKPEVENLNLKISIGQTPPSLGGRITKSIFVALFKLLYTSLKFCYEIAKFFTKGLSSIRRFLFVAK
jgi:hypothetical protein